MKKYSVKKWKNKTGQEIQDEIFARMSADKKIKLASELTMLCLKLHNLSENSKSRKATHPNGIYS